MGRRKVIFKESEASPESFESYWADRPPDLHLPAPYADHRLGGRRRQAPLVFRRNPRPVPAVSTAQINLLSLSMSLDGMVWSDCLPVSGPLIFVVIVCRWCRVGGPRPESPEIPKCPKLGGAPGALPGSGSPIYPVIAARLEDLGRVSPPCGRIST